MNDREVKTSCALQNNCFLHYKYIGTYIALSYSSFVCYLSNTTSFFFLPFVRFHCHAITIKNQLLASDLRTVVAYTFSHLIDTHLMQCNLM